MHYARNKSPQELRKNYIKNREEYQNCIRIQDLDSLNCWYGYIYTLNDSPYILRDNVMLEVKGIDAIEPIGFQPNQETMLEIESQGEHLIILRRYEGHASFVLQYAPQPRQLSDSELV